MTSTQPEWKLATITAEKGKIQCSVGLFTNLHFWAIQFWAISFVLFVNVYRQSSDKRNCATFTLCSRCLRVRFPRNRWHCNSGRPPNHMFPGRSAYSRDTISSASATHSVDVLLPRPDSLAQRCIHNERLACPIPLLERYKQPHQVRHHPSEQVLSSHV